VKAFELLYTLTASAQYDALEAARSKQFRAADKALDFLTINPRHPGLRSHKYESMKGPGGCDIWESYAENNAPGAYRIFWHYGPGPGKITIVAIVPHPK
jgi:hypothetical protein